MLTAILKSKNTFQLKLIVAHCRRTRTRVWVCQNTHKQKKKIKISREIRMTRVYTTIPRSTNFRAIFQVVEKSSPRNLSYKYTISFTKNAKKICAHMQTVINISLKSRTSRPTWRPTRRRNPSSVRTPSAPWLLWRRETCWTTLRDTIKLSILIP